MPIEVKELVIRVKVNENTPASKRDISNTVLPNKTKLVDECVERVLEKLELRLER